MASRPIRDDNLRLVLSSHEAGYIEAGLPEARDGLRQLSVVGVSAFAVGALLLSAMKFADLPKVLDYLIVIAMVFILVTVLVCFVNGVGAYLSLRRFRSYRDDHEKFLRHYRRKP